MFFHNLVAHLSIKNIRYHIQCVVFQNKCRHMVQFTVHYNKLTQYEFDDRLFEIVRFQAPCNIQKRFTNHDTIFFKGFTILPKLLRQCIVGMKNIKCSVINCVKSSQMALVKISLKRKGTHTQLYVDKL